MKLFKIVIFFFLSILIISCSKKDDIPTDIQTQNFVWKGLNAYYLWQKEINDLSDRRFSSDDELNNYLSDYDNPEDLFNNLLHIPNEYPKDPNKTYSWIVDDYIALEQSFQGTRLTTGMKVKGADFADGSGYYVYVYDVVKNSDAETKGITRGMLFNMIDGVQLTETNYQGLLFGDNTIYTVGFADYNVGNPTSNGTTISLTKEELQENPIAVSKVITDGAAKIGYLLYNQFASSFDAQLNAAFANFNSENIDDLIIDLRYNGGGSVRTATYLGSMVTGQFNSSLFSKQVWNEKVQAAIDPSNFENNFTNQIDHDGINEAIHSLGLSRVYFIVTGSSASASELIINSLSSYIDVYLVGTTTVGKQVGSITLYDSDDYTKGNPTLSQNHTYAMQPIVLEIKNSIDQNEPNGFTPGVTLPGIEFPEDYGNLGVLGERSDPLLDRTLVYIATGARINFVNEIDKARTIEISNSKLATPSGNNMYVDFKK